MSDQTRLTGMERLSSLDEKVGRLLGDRIVLKRLTRWNEAYKEFPRYVLEYLCSRYIDPADPIPGQQRVDQLLSEHYVDSSAKELIRSWVREKGSYTLLGELHLRLDERRDHYWADVPALGSNTVRVSTLVLREHGDILLTSGAWGTMAMEYDPSYEIKGVKYPFYVREFRPFQITQLSLEAYINKRTLFSDEEWLDLLIESIGFAPPRFTDREKWLYLLRLVPFVESNYNLVELGPRETGKTYTYRNTSNRSFVISGGTVKQPWDEELQLWALIFIKKETLARIPPRYGFSQSQKLVDHREPAWASSTGITEYRVGKSKKRFLGLDYGEWSNLPQDLQSVHPKCEEYQKERHRQRLEAAEDAQEDIGQTAQAHQQHLEDLLSLTREWKEHLVFDVGDAILVQESLLPSSFSKGDGTAGWHEMGPLVWLVGHDGDVEVWMALERRHRLFGALLEHLPHDVADTYEAIKTEITDALTQMMEFQAVRISVTGLPGLVSELAEKLDGVLDSRVLGGNCDVCRRIVAADVI